MLIPAYYDAPSHLEGSVPMRGDDPRHDGMFSYITPEARVRADHPLRPIRTMTDAALQRLSPRFDRLYSTIGRPSIPPEKLLRALLLQMLYSIRSERLLMEELDYNILYRWFVGLSLDDPIWDATTFTKNRDRLLDGDVADAFFAEVLAATGLEPEPALLQYMKLSTFSRAVAEAVALCRPEVICAYPITPQTHIVEAKRLPRRSCTSSGAAADPHTASSSAAGSSGIRRAPRRSSPGRARRAV